MAISKFFKIIIVLLILAAIGGFFYFFQKVYYSTGKSSEMRVIRIEKGERTMDIARKLEQEGIISDDIYFVFYIWKNGLKGKIISNKYSIGPKMTIPEVVTIITSDASDSKQIKITFPEGWTAEEMAKRISANNLSGTGDFNESFNTKRYAVAYFQNKYNYDFLKNVPEKQGLEGFLFPDTYYFYKDATPEDIIKKMLDNFENKLSSELREEISKQGKTVFEIVTMASIIEGEVKTEVDRKIVSGIFWNRIKNGQALQSCATLAYILGENKKQYSFADTRTVSPYNTYLNKGLPPGPISNPGLSAIRAAIYPTQSDYNYFLSDPATGKTVFSKTLDEHNVNKVKYGL